MLSSVEKEVDALITELNQNADRNLTLMEERLGQLQKVIAEADKRLLLLKKDGEKSKPPVQVYTHLEKSRQLNLLDREIEDTQGPQVSPVSSLVPEVKPPPVVEPAPIRMPTTREKVLSLTSQGLSPPVIARTLGVTLGEVELIQSLGNQK